MPYVTSVPLFKALSDDTRLQICLLIAHEQELCVCEFVSALQLSQPKISRHLAVLKDAQIVSTRKDRQWVFYRLNNAMPQWHMDIINTTALNNQQLLESALVRLNKMGARPSRQASCCN
ncbi:metalloregulator ArsR/SmtB family transcription factor [Pseudoalteromonas sp. SSDWG2]|uniref:metalloregulator ArsR/SmtB family transcription factor n=1 Tax=Pseudoalteromonas sp. SSDWG2 TaxID=3139391 RepID=UPI003BABF760